MPRGIDQIEDLPCALDAAALRERHRRPHGRVRVLTTVLAYTRNVALDVAGLELRAIERRIEQLDHADVATHEARIDGFEAKGDARGIAGAREQRPALR